MMVISRKHGGISILEYHGKWEKTMGRTIYYGDISL